ncbi:unnamed protein product [Mycena citricolor]|uniref:DUF6534 domain-containing protein n=1 Tax=Mycena citricolor TaxID=2018698 RepID=A0AAD2H0P5_9AGAR|nr:unnamed protein product [Mycena citricolor]
MAGSSLYTTLGPFEIGLALSTLLLGIETLQTFYYYRRYKRDSAQMKIFVGFVWICGLLQSIFAWNAMFTMTITFFGNPEHVAEPPVSMLYNIIDSTALTLFVQAFFCLRIYRLSHSKPLAIFCFALILIPTGLYFWLFSMYYTRGGFARSLGSAQGHKVMIAAAALTPVSACAVAGTLCWCLWRMKDPDQFRRTRSVVDRIMLWTVETTLVTSLASVLELIMIVAQPHNMLWLIFFFLHGKLLTNTLVASPSI